jgi:hypothetical protein
MRNSKQMALAAVVATVGMGAMATQASASSPYDITSIPAGSASFAYTGTAANAQTFKVGAAGPLVSCSAASFAGATHNVAGDVSSTAFTPTFSNCTGGVLGNVDVTVSGPWRIEVTGGSGATHTIKVDLTGSTVIIAPRAFPTCRIIVDGTGNSNITGLVAITTSTATVIRGQANAITFRVSAAGACPGVGAANYTSNTAVYTASPTTTSGGVNIPGVQVIP